MLRQWLLLLSRQGLTLAITVLLWSILAAAGSASKRDMPLTSNVNNEGVLSQDPLNPLRGLESGAYLLLQEGIELFEEQTTDSVEKSLEQFQVALQAYEMVGDISYQSLTLMMIGKANQYLEDFENALINYEEALLRARQIENRKIEGIVLLQVASLYYELIEFDKAIALNLASYLIFRDIGEEELMLIPMERITSIDPSIFENFQIWEEEENRKNPSSN